VRAFHAAGAAFALFVAPTALLAQPGAQTIPQVKRPHPMPSGALRPHRHHPPHRRRPGSYPVVIDGSAFVPHFATPAPAPKHQPTPRPSNGQDVFETHSTSDANE
jgi:hypothetical protein